MRSIIKSALSVIMLTLFISAGSQLKAQTAADGTKQYVEIKTSVQCGSCKKTVESALKNVEGIESAKVDVATKTVAVKYDSAVTSPDAIKKAINMAGYDADDMPADKAAYDNLDACCKKE